MKVEKRASQGKSKQIILERGNGKCKRPGARVILLEQRNGKEVGKVRVLTKEKNTMAAAGIRFVNQQKRHHLMI